MHGAKLEGFKTCLIYEKRRRFYRDFHFIDEYYPYDSVEEVVDILNGLGDCVVIPHGSFVEYLGIGNIGRIKVPIFGNRKLMNWESDQKLKMGLLEASGIKIPKSFSRPEAVDRPVIVKLPGAKGGRGYFVARDPEEVERGIQSLMERRMVKNVEDILIQEYVVGVPMYFQLFESRVMDRIEAHGIDIRYESNVDGLKRMPNLQGIPPSFTVVGNIPAVARESLLETVYDYAAKFSSTVRKKIPPGLIGPFCLESVVTEDQEIFVFEFSGRIVAGTNLYIWGSPYSWLYWNEPMSVRRR